MRLYTPAEIAALVTALRRWDPLVLAAAARYQVPVAVVQAVIAMESQGKERAYNPETGSAGGPSRGLMQIQEATARGLGFAGNMDRLFDPAVNVDLGAKLIRQLWDRFVSGGLSLDRVADVFAAYNGGPRMVTERMAGTPYRNQEYVSRGLQLIPAFGSAPLVVGPIALLVLGLLWWWRRRRQG